MYRISYIVIRTVRKAIAHGDLECDRIIQTILEMGGKVVNVEPIYC